MEYESYFHRHDMVFDDVIYTFLIGYDTHSNCHHYTYGDHYFSSEYKYFAFCAIYTPGMKLVAHSTRTAETVGQPKDFDPHDLVDEVVRSACIDAGFHEERRKYINHWLLGENCGLL